VAGNAGGDRGTGAAAREREVPFLHGDGPVGGGATGRDGKAVHDYAFQRYLLENRVGRVM
jgi:hypothetical protein